MREIKFDFNNMFSFNNIGNVSGASESDLKSMSSVIANAHQHLKKIFADKESRVSLSLEWAMLPFQTKETIQRTQRIGEGIARKYENVLFLGIGGSYLGLKAAQDALLVPYYHEFSAKIKKRPKIYFDGNNLDPETLGALLKNLPARKTFVVVISKSGETIETKAAFAVVESWLKKKVGKLYGRQIFAITDPESGTLRRRVNHEQKKDILSFRSLPLIPGVGGRFSEFNMGLLHLAICGINIEEVLRGAQKMAKRCRAQDIFKNPAYMYAALQYILYIKKGKSIAIMMPFSEGLKSTVDWYVQLLAESLGKKYSRQIKINSSGREIWESDKESVINVGRTPVSCRGTSDLHSIQQNNIEGENNKTITFIRVNKFRTDLKIPGSDDFLSGRYYAELMSLAQEATEWALIRQERPNCTIIMPEINPDYWGQLIYFFEIATAFEGELLNINAFNQPGVEGYKNYMYCKLGLPGISRKLIQEIKNTPLHKKGKFII